MTKKEFLDKLKVKLSVLDKNERQDIISEYTDTINEKVKSGMKEEDAVKDFGNIDDLVKEILKAYKIDPDYKEMNNKTGEEIIKEGANFLADKARKVAFKFKNANGEITLELVMEILIKIFLTLVILLFLGWVMNIFGDIGEHILDCLFSPFDTILKFIWIAFMTLLTILLSIMIVIAMFKKYFTSANEPVKKAKKDTKEIKKKPAEKVIIKKENYIGKTLSDIFLIIVKVFVIVWIIVPIIFIDLAMIFLLILSVVYMIKGLDLFGLVLLFAGTFGIITYLVIALFNLLFNKKKLNFIPLIVSILLIIVGGIIFTLSIMEYTYIDKAPNEKTKVYTEIVDVTDIDSIHGHYSSTMDKITDNNMPDNQIKLEVSYYKDYNDINVSREKITEDCEYRDACTPYEKNIISIYNTNKGNHETIKLYNLFIKNVKKKEVYDYNKLFESHITITGNEKTLTKLG